MNTNVAMILFASLISTVALADFNLANNKKAVVCYADDNQGWVLSASRKTLKYTVEGESLGAKKVTKIGTDGDTFVSYRSSVGTLFLDDRGDRFLFSGESEAGEISGQ